MTSIKFNELTIGEIVVSDFRAAGVFKNAGIDFCCGGKKSLNKACTEIGIDQKKLEKDLEDLSQIPNTSFQNFNDWNLGFLCDYIENTHHKFVLKNLPELEFYTQKIAAVHGENHPELIQISDLFSKIKGELEIHLKMEEEVLFPAIKQSGINLSAEVKSVIINEITRMTAEHEFAGEAMDKINYLSRHYSIPDDACNTYRVAYKLLEQFEDDLHIHVHLENNILYHKAMLIVN